MTDTSSVLHIVPSLFTTRGYIAGGAERYAFELARHMADQAPTRLVSFGEQDRHETVGGLSVRIIGNPWHVRGQSHNPMALSLFAELRRAEVIHCHQQHILASSLAAVACRLLRRRIFVSDHGGGGWDISAYVSTDAWYHGHLHVSKYSRRIFGQEEKPFAHVIYGGVDTEKFSPDQSVPREQNILFVGRILPHKGIDNLIKALPEGMSLEVIGVSYDPRYLQDLRELANGKRVAFIHDCDDQTLVMAYRRALCVVLPSVYRNLYGGETKVPELLGQTLIEGMACATPAICTDVASMPEVVEDGVTGFVVPPNDPEQLRQRIAWLAEHPTEAKEMGERARNSVLAKFTWPLVVRRCLEIYGR